MLEIKKNHVRLCVNVSMSYFSRPNAQGAAFLSEDHHFEVFVVELYDTIRYDTRCYINVRLKANMSQLNLPHGADN